MELLLEMERSHGWGHTDSNAAIAHQLHAAAGDASHPDGVSGGSGLWVALLKGAMGCDHGQDDLHPFNWRKALFQIGIAVLRRQRDALATLAAGWSIDIIHTDWEKQLEQTDETMGWCLQNLDDIQQIAKKWAIESVVGDGIGADIGACVDTEDGRKGQDAKQPLAWPTLRWAILDPEAREAVQQLKTARRARKQVQDQAIHPSRAVLGSDRYSFALTAPSRHRTCTHVGGGFADFAAWRAHHPDEQVARCFSSGSDSARGPKGARCIAKCRAISLCVAAPLSQAHHVAHRKRLEH